MTYEDIAIEADEGLGILTLNRPGSGNAVRPETMAEICRGIDELASNDGVKAIILRGEGKHFCAGAEFSFLDQLTRMTPLEIQHQIYTHFQGAAKRIYQCRKPTIALVAGTAVTVGCELALACDFRLVAEDAAFQESWIKLGLIAPLGGLFLLPRMVGIARAKQMLLRGEVIKAQAALDMGLVTEVVPRDDLFSRGKEFAHELSSLAPMAYGSAKVALHRGLETSMEAEWSANVLSQAILLNSNDFREGLAAIKEKRKPKFHGN